MSNETIKISKDKLCGLYNILTGYPQISKEQVINEMQKTFGKEVFMTKDITERIKTFEDACNELGEEHPFVRSYNGYANNIHEDNKNDTDILAYLKLRIIAAALNEDWKPQFTIDEYRWYPWFELYTQEELDRMDEKERRRCVLRSGGSNASSGLACANAVNASSYSYTSYGARLAFKSEKLAVYAGRQFMELWADFCFKPKAE